MTPYPPPLTRVAYVLSLICTSLVTLSLLTLIALVLQFLRRSLL
jgi:hypothetical protein